ncbi:MAG: tetratricopeptide repeat protein [Chloroflexi bacterium]|nr:tetratricopeptide repeat protein [Chloroflexota bacterium]
MKQRKEHLRIRPSNLTEETVVTLFKSREEAISPKEQRERAISLALLGLWEEAEQVNRELLESFPEDIEAHKRLGKALMELGRDKEARGAFEKALAFNPGDPVARRNLAKLQRQGKNDGASLRARTPTLPNLFIEEIGKSAATPLIDLAPRPVLARTGAGKLVRLLPRRDRLVVETVQGQYLGRVEPRTAKRLLELMALGNKYAAAVLSASDDHLRIIIKETFQHPNAKARLSFPTRQPDDFRPYASRRLLQYGDEETEKAGAEEAETEDDKVDGEGRPSSSAGEGAEEDLAAEQSLEEAEEEENEDSEEDEV